jgi:hypothetical protein
MTMNIRDRNRLIDLVNELNECRQAYDDAVAPEHPILDHVITAGNHLSNVAYELHYFLTSRLTEVTS